MGMPDPNMAISFNGMQQQAWLKSLTQFLVKKDIIDEGEFMLFFKQEMLEKLKSAREEIAAAMRMEKMRDLDIMPAMSVPKAKPRLQ